MYSPSSQSLDVFVVQLVESVWVCFGVPWVISYYSSAVPFTVFDSI